MPIIREYVVTQTREVRVTANSVEDAAQIGAAAFIHGQDSDFGVAKDKAPAGVWGNTRSKILPVEMTVREIH